MNIIILELDVIFFFFFFFFFLPMTWPKEGGERNMQWRSKRERRILFFFFGFRSSRFLRVLNQ